MQSHIAVRSVLATALLLPWLMAAPNALANQDAALDHLAVLIECHGEAEAHARLLAEVTLNLISNDEWSAVNAGAAWTVRHSDGGR